MRKINKLSAFRRWTVAGFLSTLLGPWSAPSPGAGHFRWALGGGVGQWQHEFRTKDGAYLNGIRYQKSDFFLAGQWEGAWLETHMGLFFGNNFQVETRSDVADSFSPQNSFCGGAYSFQCTRWGLTGEVYFRSGGLWEALRYVRPGFRLSWQKSGHLTYRGERLINSRHQTMALGPALRLWWWPASRSPDRRHPRVFADIYYDFGLWFDSPVTLSNSDFRSPDGDLAGRSEYAGRAVGLRLGFSGPLPF